MASTLPRLPVFEAIASHDPQSTAVVHCTSGRHFTYCSLLKDVADAKDQLHQAAGSQAVEGQRVAFLVENGYDYVGATPAWSRCCRGRLTASSDSAFDSW